MKIYDSYFNSKSPLVIIAGPCVIESEQQAIDVAGTLKDITKSLGFNYIYKSSFLKDNRTSINSFSGLNFDKSLYILQKVKKLFSIPILTDIHTIDYKLIEISKIVDVLQIPALLCRQTSLISFVAKMGLPVNIKKGQFLPPYKMKYIVEKFKNYGNNKIMICERGFSFGYNDLIVDMRSLILLKKIGCPVIFDAGHSVQRLYDQDKTSGNVDFIKYLSYSAIILKLSGLFFETHPNPEKALCDGDNSLPLNEVKEFLIKIKKIDDLSKNII